MSFPVATRGTGTLITAAIWKSDLVDNLNDLYSSGRIFVSAAQIAFGASVPGNGQVTIGGTFTAGSGDGRALNVVSSVTALATRDAYGLYVAPTIVEAGSATHPLLASVYVAAPTVTSGAATVTDAATVYIGGAPSAVVSGANYALWVASGLVRFDGGQIQFPATQNPSSNPNTLDEYEEGTWTPVLGGSGGAPTGQAYGDQRGWYLKQGKTVWIAGEMHLTTKGTITGTLRITGLPFTSENLLTGQSACAFADFDGTPIAMTWISGFIVANSNHVQVRYKDTDASGSMSSPDTTLIQDGTACGFMAMYRTDS